MGYTGYMIKQYWDINPNSPTYMQKREERVADSACTDAPEYWVEISRACEFVNSIPTGYLLKTMMNVQFNSSNYGKKTVERVYDTELCPLSNPNPNWVEDPNFTKYCELMYYEPGHVQGYSGNYIIQLIDDNMYSPTARQTVISAVTNSDHCPRPNTFPMFEDFTGYCELDSEGKNTGVYIVTNLDKNVFSPTYLSVVTERYHDEVNCPTHVFSCDDYSFFDEGTVAASSGGTIRLGTYVNSGDLILTPVSYPSWMSDFGESVLAGRRSKSLHCICAANNSGAQRAGTVVFSGSSGNCSFSATVIQNYDEPAFDCSEYGFNNESSVVPASGGTFRLGTYVNSGDLILTPVSYPNWLSDFGESVLAGRRSKSLHCICAANETGSDRQGTVVFSGTSGDCQFTATFIQYAEAPTPPPTPSFSCNDYYFTPSLSTVDASGGTNIIVADYVDSQSLSLSVSSKPAWVTNPSEGTFIGHSMRSLVVDIVENTGETRTGTIVYRGNSGDCSFSVTITQTGETTQACENYNFIDNHIGIVDTSGATNVLFATYNKSAELVVSSCPSWITDLNPSAVDGAYYAVSGNVTPNTGSTRRGNINLVPADGGSCLFTVTVIQEHDSAVCANYQVEDYDAWVNREAQDVTVGESSKSMEDLSFGSLPDWVSDSWVDDTSDTKYRYIVHVNANSSGSARTGQIIINNGDCEFTLNVTQTEST